MSDYFRINSLKVWVDVDIVCVANQFNVTARSHGVEAVSTQELDAGSRVLTPLLGSLAVGSLFL